MPIDPRRTHALARASQRWQDAPLFPPSLSTHLRSIALGLLAFTLACDLGVADSAGRFSSLTQSQEVDEADAGAVLNGRSALLVVGPAGVQDGDAPIAALMNAMGLDVRTTVDSEVAASLSPLPDLLVVSSTARSYRVAPAIQGLAIPLVTWEPWLFDDLHLTAAEPYVDYGFGENSTALTIVNDAHPLAAGLSGEQVVYSTPHAIGWGYPGEAAQVAAYSTESGAPVLFGYDRGATLANGLVAPSRRVGFFAHSAGPFQLSNAGQALLEQALQWAAAAEGNSQGLQANQAIFVVASHIMRPADDTALSIMMDLALHPLVVTPSEFRALPTAAYDLVVVSNTVHSASVSDLLAREQAPIVLWEPWLYDDLGMTGPEAGVDYSYDRDSGTIEMAPGEHPLGAGLSGVQYVYMHDPELAWGSPGAAAEVIARHPQTDQPTLFAYEQGATLVNAEPALSRRVALFAKTDRDRHFTPAGFGLIEAALRWALQTPAAEPAAGTDEGSDTAVSDAGIIDSSDEPTGDATGSPPDPAEPEVDSSDSSPDSGAAEDDIPESELDSDDSSSDSDTASDVDASGSGTPAPGESDAPTTPITAAAMPAHMATDVSTAITITLTLSEPLPFMADLSVVKLLDASGAEVDTLVGLSTDQTTLRIDPTRNLAPGTTYSVAVTETILNESGAELAPFSTQFTTAVALPDPLSFRYTPSAIDDLEATTSLAVGPDGNLYVVSVADDQSRLYRYLLDPFSGVPIYPAEPELLYATQEQILGFTFAPNLPVGDSLTIWFSHANCNSLAGRAPPDGFSGALSRLTVSMSGSVVAPAEDRVVVGLPTTSDHCSRQVNGLQFGPDGRLYVSVGGATSLGGTSPIGDWESPLSAAIVVLDPAHSAFTEESLPVSVQATTSGVYDPTDPDAPVQLFASGVRDGYDLLWHSFGHLFTAIAQNGDTTATTYPCGGIDAVSDLPAATLAQVKAGHYYGHPNAARDECVLAGGNPSAAQDAFEVLAYPEGTLPETHFDPTLLYDLQPSGGGHPSGVTEIAAAGPLQHRLLIAYFEGSTAVQTFAISTAGQVLDSQPLRSPAGAPLTFTGPRDVAVHPQHNLIYVADFGAPSSGTGGSLVLLTPASAF